MALRQIIKKGPRLLPLACEGEYIRENSRHGRGIPRQLPGALEGRDAVPVHFLLRKGESEGKMRGGEAGVQLKGVAVLRDRLIRPAQELQEAGSLS